MKRTLSFLFSLFVLCSPVFADYNITIATSEVAVAGSGGTSTESFGGAATLSKVDVYVRTGSTLRKNSFEIGTYDGGDDIYDEAPNSTSLYQVSSSWSSNKSNVSAIYFKNNTTGITSGYKRYYKDITLHIVKAAVEFSSAPVGESPTKTFNYFTTGGAPSQSGFTSSESHFSVINVTFVDKYCYSVTVKFQPEEIKSYSGEIKYGGNVVAAVSGTGSLSAPTNLTNTDLENTSASFSWNAVTGATGYRLINKTTGATVNATSTSATMTGLTADTNYNFAVVALSGSIPSSESNVVNVTTLFYDPTRCIFQHIAGPIDYKKGESYIIEFETSTTSPFKISVAYELSNPEGITASGDYTWIKYAKNGQTQSTHFNETQIKKIPTDSYKKYEETIMDDHVTGFKFESDNKNKYCRLKNLVVYYNTGLTSTNTTDGIFDFGTVAANSKTTKYITVDYANASGENLRVTDLTGTGFSVGDFGTIGSCQVGTVQIPVTYDATHGFGLKQAELYLGNGQSLKIVLKATVALAPPTNVKVADKTNTSITISWDKVAGATGYRIKMGGTTVDVQGENNTTYTWTGLNPDTDYTFTVMTLRTESGSTSVSTESDPVTGHTLFYDPSRCVVLADAAQYSFTSGGEKDYYFFNIPGWKVSPFPLEAHFELLKEDGVASWQSVTVNSWDNTTGEWTDGIKEIDADDVNIYSWKQWDCTVPANSKAIQFETGANKHFYVKNVVVYYTAGLSADVTSVDFGTVATGSITTKQFTVTYANATPLTATVTGDGFAAVETISETVGCGVGTITFKVKFTADAAWEGLTKNGNINFSNGATLDIPLTAIVKMNKVQDFAVTSSTTNSVSLSWTENAYAEKYEITTGGVTKTVTAPASAFEFPELASNTSYEFSIVAVKGEQKSDAATVTGKTLMVGPSNVQAVTEGSSITLSWDPVEGADGYKIKNKTTGEVITILPSQVPYEISPIEPGKDYEFEIITMKDGNEQGSTSKNVTLPSLPGASNLETEDVTTTGMTLTWDPVEGATGYKLIRKQPAPETVIETSATSPYELTGLTAGTEYEFELVTMYGDKEQGKSSIKKSTLLPAPSNIEATPTSTSIILEWDEVPGADKYIIRRAGESDIEVTASQLPYTISPLASDTEYEFEIITVKGGEEQGSETVNAKTLLAAPSNIDITTGPTSITIKFDEVPGADEYKIILSPSGTEITVTKDDLPYTISPVEPGVDYEVEITTIKDDKEQGSTTKQVSLDKLPAASNLEAEDVTTEGMTLTWDEVPGATGYKLINKTTGAEQTITAPATEAVLTGLTAGTEYEFELVTMYNDKEQEKTTLTKSTLLPAPSDIEATPSTTSVTLNWDPVPGADKYIIRRAGESDIVITDSDLPYVISGLETGTDYEFEIITVKNDEEQGSETVNVTTLLPAPSNIDITTGPTSITIDFDEVPGADEYKITLSPSGTEITVTKDELPYTISPVEPGVDYEIEITTIKDGQEQGSETKQVSLDKLPAADNFAASDITTESIKLSWDAVTGATGYKLVDAKTGTEITTIDAPATTYTYSGLNPDTEYEFKLVTMYNDDEQESTEKITAKTEAAGAAKVDGVVYATLNEAIAAAGGKEIELLKNVTENIDITTKVVLKGNHKTIGDVVIESNGDLELTGDITVNDFILKSECVNDGDEFKSGQYYGGAMQLNLQGNAYIDITLDPSGTGSDNKWYSFTVPFPVDSRNGVYKMVGDVATPGAWGSTYAILQYDAVKRASGSTGWVYAGGTLTPGKFYQIGTDGTNTFRFKKTSGSALVTAETSYTLEAHPAAEAVDANWNALGNNALYFVNASTSMADAKVQIYVNGDGEGANGRYTIKTMDEVDFNVAAPFFVQYADAMGSTLTLTRATGTKSAVETMTSEFDVRIAAKGADDYADRLFVSASSEAKNEYELGFDVAKLGDLGKSASAMLWVKAYNINLAACRAPLSGVSADFDLSIYAPADGVYNLYLGKEVNSNETLYLTKNGEIIADMADSYALSLKKGTTDVYGLRIVVDDIETSAQDGASDAKAKPFKFIENNEVFINANGTIYNLQGVVVKK